MSVHDYFLGPRKSRSGRTLAFSRLDIALSIVLGVTLLAAISYSADPGGGWTKLRIFAVLGLFIATTVIAQHRLIVFGCALGIVTMRLAVGVLGDSHQLFFLVSTLVCGLALGFF
jgi:hypothetical protein